MTDAASRHQFEKLANLGFQDQIASLSRKNPATKISALRQKLHSYFSTQSRPPPNRFTIQQDNHTNPCTTSINTHLPPSKSSKLASILTISKPTWQLPDSYDMMNLHGIHANHIQPPKTTYNYNLSLHKLRASLASPILLRKICCLAQIRCPAAIQASLLQSRTAPGM